MSINAAFRLIGKNRDRLKPRVIVATAASVEVPYTNALEGGVVVSNKGRAAATTFVLPPALPGMRVSAVIQAAQELRLDPNGTETVALPTGVQQASGKYIVADAIGETINLICITAGTWDVLGSVGTFTAES